MSRSRRAGWLAVGIAALAAIVLGSPVSAQSEALELKMRRVFGFAMGADVQGSFLLTAEGPGGLQQVTFLVDAETLAVDSAPPFEARLHTGDFPLGLHRLWAEGTRSDGSRMASNVIQASFVAASASWQAALRMLLPVFAIVGLAALSGIVLAAAAGRRYRPGSYGPSGGAICPRCRLPMNRHLVSPNMGVGKKLERCPHCGAWSRVPRATSQELAAGEARLRGETAPQVSAEAQSEALRRQVDDSRFVD